MAQTFYWYLEFGNSQIHYIWFQMAGYCNFPISIIRSIGSVHCSPVNRELDDCLLTEECESYQAPAIHTSALLGIAIISVGKFTRGVTILTFWSDWITIIFQNLSPIQQFYSTIYLVVFISIYVHEICRVLAKNYVNIISSNQSSFHVDWICVIYHYLKRAVQSQNPVDIHINLLDFLGDSCTLAVRISGQNCNYWFLNVLLWLIT